jgi:hypothetical protein
MSIRIRSSLFAFLLAIGIASSARADDDGLETHRRRVKDGLTHYEAGRFADAIVAWQPVYEELGAKKGYRLSFNLARAYEAYGDATRAAERYAAFLDELDARVAAGDPIEPVVRRNADEARERLRELASKYGRLKLAPATPPVLVAIDGAEPRLAGFTAFVRPGRHKLTFGAGAPTSKTIDVDVTAGALLEVASPAATAPPPTPSAREAPAMQTERPFSPVVLYVGAAITAASIALPVGLYFHALGARDDYRNAADDAAAARTQAEYEDRKDATYVGIAVTASLAAVTGGLTAWYFLGSRTRTGTTVVVTPYALGASAAAVF